MRGRISSAWFMLAAAMAAVAQPNQSLFAQPLLPSETPAAGGDDYEVLTRGPVHEAFAELAIDAPRPGPIVPQRPPQDIDEQPPETRPAGENVVWLPGYWHFDDERQDFLWVSGLWRAAPPGREWTPGYWREAQGGYQWVSGYWAEAGAAAGEVTYLPPPPESLEAGPTSPPPAGDHVWAPGCWVWRSTRYVWRPGSWILLQPNWIWIPHYYAWTPYGCVLAGGYADYPFSQRGLLCAPVYFPRPIYARPTFFFRPRHCIGFDVLTAYLFARPRTCHYYFGDYFAPRYARLGCYPWFSVPWGRGTYDPLFAHYRALNRRSDRDWDRRLIERHAYLRDNAAARPPRTFAQQLERGPRAGDDRGPRGARPLQIAQPLEGFRQAARERYGLELRTASGEQLRRAAQGRSDWRGLQAVRRAAEVQSPPAEAAQGGVRRARWNAENPAARDLADVRQPRDFGRAQAPQPSRLAQPRSRLEQALESPSRGPTVDRGALERLERRGMTRPDATPRTTLGEPQRATRAPAQARQAPGGNHPAQGLRPPERPLPRLERGSAAGAAVSPNRALTTPRGALERSAPRGANPSEPRARAAGSNLGNLGAPRRPSLQRSAPSVRERAAAPAFPQTGSAAPRGGRRSAGELRRGSAPSSGAMPRPSADRPAVQRPLAGGNGVPGAVLRQPASRAQPLSPQIGAGGEARSAPRGAFRAPGAPSGRGAGAVGPGPAAMRAAPAGAAQAPQRDAGPLPRARRGRGG